MVDKTLLKQEEKQTTKKGPKEAPKLQRTKTQTPELPNQKRRLSTVEPNREYCSDTEDAENFFYLRLMNEKNQEVGQLRADGMQTLKNLANDIVRILLLIFWLARRQAEVYQLRPAADDRAS